MSDMDIVEAARILSRVTEAAQVLGRYAGSRTSDRKARAARENGKKGGRPRKVRPADTENESGQPAR